MDELIAVIDSHDPGETVAIELLRDGEPETFDVELGDRPADALS